MSTIEQKIADIAAKQKAQQWEARQEAARQQQAEAERQRIERYRNQRIAQINDALKGIPTRRKHVEMAAKDAEELAFIWTHSRLTSRPTPTLSAFTPSVNRAGRHALNWEARKPRRTSLAARSRNHCFSLRRRPLNVVSALR